MMQILPADALAFLSSNKPLEYDVESSEIGEIVLKRLDDLHLSTLRVPISGECDVDDPYDHLEGHYLVDSVDIVAESADYDPIGLLCWLPLLNNYGSIDREHGVIRVFASATWQNIVAHPAAYLDAQWHHDSAVSRTVLAWQYFPFQLTDQAIRLHPYPAKCPLHHSELQRLCISKPPMLSIFKAQDTEDWLQSYLVNFPCAGVPDQDGNLLCCCACRSAEDRWLKDKEDAIVPMEAKPNQAGYVLCPGCQIRFSVNDSNRFQNGVHLSCGQKIHIVRA